MNESECNNIKEWIQWAIDNSLSTDDPQFQARSAHLYFYNDINQINSLPLVLKFFIEAADYLERLENPRNLYLKMRLPLAESREILPGDTSALLDEVDNLLSLQKGSPPSEIFMYSPEWNTDVACNFYKELYTYVLDDLLPDQFKDKVTIRYQCSKILDNGDIDYDDEDEDLYSRFLHVFCR